MSEHVKADFDEARAVLRRGKVMIPLTQWLKPEEFLSIGPVLKAIHHLLPKSVIMGSEQRDESMFMAGDDGLSDGDE